MAEAITAEERTAIERFPLVAEEFCHLIDGCAEFSRKQLVQELQTQLAHLLEVATRLPWVSPATEGVDHDPQTISAHTEEWAKLSGELRKIFADLDGYWEVFDPTAKEEPVFGSLSIDIAEIYLDLKDALGLPKSGAVLNDIQWDWRFEFRSHWSKHAANALKVLLHISDLA